MRALFFIFSILFFFQYTSAQCLFEVNNGGFEYTVDVDLEVSNVIYSQEGTTCNVQFEVDYDVVIDITSAPAWWDQNLWVLQANFNCVGGSGNSFFDLPNGGGSGTVTSATFSFNNMNCGDVTLDCPITLEIQGPGGLNTSEPCGTYEEFGVVPVVLKSFDVTKKTETTILTWETSSEINFSHFEIETSVDARNWELVELKEGGYNPEGSIYSLELPNQNESYYVRLVMVDADGYFAYSDVHFISDHRIAFKEIGMYPNPAMTMVYFDNLPSDAVVHIYDFNGRFHFSETVTNHKLDIARLNRGQYIMKLEFPEGENEFRKLLVL